MARRKTATIGWAVGAALLALAAAATWMPARAGRGDALPAVRLVDHHGRPITSDALFAGRWSFLFLGFTSCPNVCPATLAQLGAIKRSLARQFPGTPQPRYVFVSVDPQRDTPARLSSYLTTFDPDFIGATGEPVQIAALSDALSAFHRLGASKSPDDYGVLHSGEIYLLDPAGRVRARFTPPLDTELLPRQVISMMAESG
jgi:protein SCO1/2